MVRARGIDFRALVLDGGTVALAAMSVFSATAALFIVAGGTATFERLLAWGRENPRVGAARVVAGGVSIVLGIAIGVASSAHFLSHYRAAGWAALANGAVFAGGLVVGAALFVPIESVLERAVRHRQPDFRAALAWTALVVAVASVAFLETIFQRSLVLTGPVVLIQAAALRWPPRVPRAVDFFVTRAFVVGCVLLLYARVFGVPANNANPAPRADSRAEGVAVLPLVADAGTKVDSGNGSGTRLKEGARGVLPSRP